MKASRQILELINHGFKSNLLINLNENQITALHNRLVEVKKESNEQVTTTTKQTKTITVPQNIAKTTGADIGNVNVKTDANGNVIATEMTENNNFIQKANSKIKKKGTEGKFGAWCKKQGLDFNGEVTKKCIDKAMKSDDSSVVKMANFANNIGGYHNAKHKNNTKKVESKEGYSDVLKSTYSRAVGNNISKMVPHVKFGENLEKRISNLLEKHLPAKMSKKDFINLINYKNNILESSNETAPVKTPPKVKPGTKPNTPDTPYKPKPGPKTAPKAEKNEMVENETAPVKPLPKVKPGTKPNTPDTPYKPKPGSKPAPKAKKNNMPSWLTYSSIGLNLN
jgi:hypothetical protein